MVALASLASMPSPVTSTRVTRPDLPVASLLVVPGSTTKFVRSYSNIPASYWMSLNPVGTDGAALVGEAVRGTAANPIASRAIVMPRLIIT